MNLKTYQLIFNNQPGIVDEDFINLKTYQLIFNSFFLGELLFLSHLKTYQLIFNTLYPITSLSPILFKNLSVDIQWS